MAFKSVIDDFKKIKAAIKEDGEKKGGSYNNPLVFKPVAVKGEEKTKFRLRFLPVQESKIGKPWMEIRYHMFERDGDNKYVKVIDPRSINKDAKNPINDLASKLWKSDNALDKEKAKKYFGKQRYFTLVYVKEAPENQKDFVGKVLVYEVGKQIHDRLASAIDEYDKCFWDPFKGEDFLLVIAPKGGEENWPDYTQSNWIGAPGPISTDDNEMASVEKQLEAITIKTAVIEKEGIKSAAELEELLTGGLKAAGKNSSEGTDVTSESKAAVAPQQKPVAQKAATPDFGDSNVVAKAPTTQKPATPAPKAATPVAQESVPATDDSMEFNVDLSDIKF